jgi:hypothetical protein
MLHGFSFDKLTYEVVPADIDLSEQIPTSRHTRESGYPVSFNLYKNGIPAFAGMIKVCICDLRRNFLLQLNEPYICIGTGNNLDKDTHKRFFVKINDEVCLKVALMSKSNTLDIRVFKNNRGAFEVIAKKPAPLPDTGLSMEGLSYFRLFVALLFVAG